MTQTVTNAVAVRQKQDQLVGWLRRQQDDIAMAAASHIKPSAVIRVTQGALRRNEKLAQAAIANPQSLLYALLDCARLGHEPDTDDYYLVPFGSEVTGIEGYKGIVSRMYNGGCLSVVAQVVRQRDGFRSRGENTPPYHEYDPFADPEDRGPLKGAYAYAILPSGRCSQVITMGRAEIMKHKAKSRGSDKADSPWQQWEEPMWKKCPLRGLEPYVPTATEKHTTPSPGPGTYVPTSMPAAADVHAVDAAPVDAEVVEETPQPSSPSNPETAGTPPDPAATPEAAQDGGSPPADQAPPRSAGGPGKQHRGLVGVVQRHFQRLGFTDDERDERLAFTAQLAQLADGQDLASSSDLTVPQLQKVADGLAKCKNRAALIELLHGDGETT